MKEKILNQIKGKLGKTSLSERTLEGKAARLALKYKTEEEFTSEILDDVISDLKELDGQLSHDVAEKIKESLEKQEPPKQDEGQSEELKKILEEMKALQESINSQRSDLEKEKLSQRILSRMKSEAGADNGFILETAIAKVDLNSNKSEDDLLKDCISVYDKNYKATFGDGGSPRKSAESIADSSKKELDAFFADKPGFGKEET